MRHALAGAAAVVLTASLASASGGDDRARLDYVLQCQGCHLADGTGKPDAVPSLVDSVGRFAVDPEGRAFLVRVPGSAFSPLSDARLAAVLNWMVLRFGPAEAAARFTPFDAGEVATARRDPLSEVEPVRRELLLRLQRFE